MTKRPIENNIDKYITVPLFIKIILLIKKKLFQFKNIFNNLCKILPYFYLVKNVSKIFKNYVIIFPYNNLTLNCGLCSIVSLKKKELLAVPDKTPNDIFYTVEVIASKKYQKINQQNYNIISNYLGGENLLKFLFYEAKLLKKNNNFLNIFLNKKEQKEILIIIDILSNIVKKEYLFLEKNGRIIDSKTSSIILNRLKLIKDIIWSLDKDLINNIYQIEYILPKKNYSNKNIIFFKQINTVLNSLDKLEVRGRDSAGISILIILKLDTLNAFETELSKKNLKIEFTQRQSNKLLNNKNITCNKTKNSKDTVSIAITYKIALEIGSLGENTKFLRQEIKTDKILLILSGYPWLYHTISSHTRWASVGSINEANCHPIDNIIHNKTNIKQKIIHVCLNGEIDNYLELQEISKTSGSVIQKEITTDTKIIAIKIEEYIDKGINIIEAFRKTVNSFKGSHAIVMHTDLAPGKMFIAQKGSGQSMFIGLHENSYIPSSEIYGFVEETDVFLKMNGDKTIYNKYGNKVQGQIFILDQRLKSKPNNIIAMYYDGTPIQLKNSDIQQTNITSRDIDRKNFEHYFLKELYESPKSVERTLKNKWINKQSNGIDNYTLKLNKKTMPLSIRAALKKKIIKRIFFIGQGTSGVAAQACSDILKYFLTNSNIYISALRASEFSGFELKIKDSASSLDNTLVIAISQSGTTADTNHAIDMAKSRNAYTLAIVNRRDSDITFKVDGVMYTSTGRDIEMSVASTKAFYSQITAGELLCLQITHIIKARAQKFISKEIENILKLPSQMQKVLKLESNIKKSAQQLALKKKYWAIVGSGPNKIAADEIRIKLSELCYKTISSDFVEDKKHIDLSSEPLILVCAAGLNNQVIGDIIKETAIFKAHKAITIVIANEEEKRFKPYADNIFYVPRIPQHLAPILNTLVGHIWGYHAALSINKISKLLNDFRNSIQKSIDNYTLEGFDAFEIIRKKSFRNKINTFYKNIRLKIRNNHHPIKITNYTDITLLLKYLSGRLPMTDFEIDFGKKGTAIEIIKCFFKTINKSINDMSRPIDAIRHQAKTVTVGTSRITTQVNGILFEALKFHNLKVSQIANKNIIVLKNLQKIINTIAGSVLYTISKLDSLGEAIDITEIKIKTKSGILKNIKSRVEKDNKLKGTKRLIVSREDVYVGKGRTDNQNIIIIPARSNKSDEFNEIRYLLLLNITFKTKISIATKIKALGGKYDNIKNIVHENSLPWNDKYIEKIKTDSLFGFSAEKVGEYIVSKQNGTIIQM